MTPTYRPSCVVNLRLRFEEDAINISTPEPVSVENMIARGATTPRKPTTSPDFKAAGDPESYLRSRVPKAASFELPGYRQAGSFNITFDFAQLPIDPRIVRSCAVDIHTGSVSATDFARGMLNVYDKNGERVSVIRPGTDSTADYASTCRFVGLVDEWKVTHGDSGSVVELRGRDLRGVLLDVPIDVVPGNQKHLLESLDLSRPIDEIVLRILSVNPFFASIQVVVNAAEWPDGVVPSPKSADIVPRVQKGAKGQASGGQASGGDKMSFWDLITKLCYFVGAVPYFKGIELRIRPSRTIYDQAVGDIDPIKNPTPFAGGIPRSFDEKSGASISPSLRWRRLVYGRDISSLSFDRKFAGWRKPNYVRCIGSLPTPAVVRNGGRVVTSSQSYQPVVGWYPPLPENVQSKPKTGFLSKKKTTEATKVSPSNQIADNEVMTIPVPGVNDKRRLEEIARAIYEEIGRGELGGAVETPCLASFGGGNTDPDLLSLSPGDGVELRVDTRPATSGAPLVSTYTDSERFSVSDAVRNLTKALGGDDRLARAIVLSTRGQQKHLQRFFRVQTVHYTWSERGFKIAFDFQNYVVPRNQVGTSSVQPKAPKRSAVPGRK
jgi:hypothetical protein